MRQFSIRGAEADRGVMNFSPRSSKSLACRAVILTVAVLLALGAQAGAAIASVLNVALAVPQRSTQEEHEERHDHGKAAATDRRNRDRHPEPGRATLAARARLPIPTLAPRTPLPAGVLPDHESDHRCGLGAPLRC
jgi:hypothetical protein